MTRLRIVSIKQEISGSLIKKDKRVTRKVTRHWDQPERGVKKIIITRRKRLKRDSSGGLTLRSVYVVITI